MTALYTVYIALIHSNTIIARVTVSLLSVTFSLSTEYSRSMSPYSSPGGTNVRWNFHYGRRIAWKKSVKHLRRDLRQGMVLVKTNSKCSKHTSNWNNSSIIEDSQIKPNFVRSKQLSGASWFTPSPFEIVFPHLDSNESEKYSCASHSLVREE